MPDLAGLARLNRRCCFGHFFDVDGRLGIRASFCVYEKEPAAQWVTLILLRAMGEQLALGYGIAQSELMPSTLAGNRANLEYPRRWETRPDPAAFESSAEHFRQRGLISTRGPHGLVLEVPLDNGSPSRMLDPKAETALLHVSHDVPHPLAGVGYVATIALPIDPRSADIPPWCARLNAAEFIMQDFVPRLGAWGMRGVDNELVYSFFLPATTTSRSVEANIMNWNVQRVLWLKQRFWQPGLGLRMEGADV